MNNNDTNNNHVISLLNTNQNISANENKNIDQICSLNELTIVANDFDNIENINHIDIENFITENRFTHTINNISSSNDLSIISKV